MWHRYYIEDKNGVSIIDSIPHCHTENVLKTGKNQEIWLRYYKEGRNGVSIIDSIPHCHTEIVFKIDKIKKCGFISKWRKNESFIIDTIPRCLIDVL